jgi:creatinine amidohydrolase/Fe(II)-dependent formamide hydrolase-like protein
VAGSRSIAELTSPDVIGRLRETSILCLPLGAIEQHGPHLPLNTDVVIAEGLTRELVARWGEPFDLWQLPPIPIGLSREHDWAPGTLSLSLITFVTLLRDLARDIARALPARNLVIVNGHGGNRGVLENLLREFQGDFALNACAIHPFDLAKVAGGAFDVHGGASETSVMLALAPDLVRRDLIARPAQGPDAETIRSVIFDRGTTWPWRTDDPRLAHHGVIGDASAATAELGAAMVESVVVESRGVFERLLENQQRLSGSRGSR